MSEATREAVTNLRSQRVSGNKHDSVTPFETLADSRGNSGEQMND